MKKIVAIFALSALLVGCGDDMPPQCDSPDTKGVLNEIIDDFLNFNDNSIASYSVTGHEMLKELKNAKEYTCQARIIWNYKDNTLNSETIKYSVFLDQNEKDTFVVQIEE